METDVTEKRKDGGIIIWDLPLPGLPLFSIGAKAEAEEEKKTESADFYLFPLLFFKGKRWGKRDGARTTTGGDGSGFKRLSFFAEMGEKKEEEGAEEAQRSCQVGGGFTKNIRAFAECFDPLKAPTVDTL